MSALDRPAMEREIAGLWRNLNEIARKLEELQAQLDGQETSRPGGSPCTPPRPPAPEADFFFRGGEMSANAKPSLPRMVEADFWPCQKEAVVERWMDCPAPGLWTVRVRNPYRAAGGVLEFVLDSATAAAAEYRQRLGEMLIESGQRLKEGKELPSL